MATTLPYNISDHFPILLQIGRDTQWGGGYFKFQNMWWRDQTLKGAIEEWWKDCHHIKGMPSYCFSKKLSVIKDKLKVWNKETFKNIFAEKAKLEGELEALNKKVMVEGMNRMDFLKEKELKSGLSEILAREEIYWRDKARELWIKEGDKNTQFFHAFVKARKALNQINEILDENGKIHQDRDSMGQATVEYFAKLLNAFEDDDTLDRFEILKAIPKLISGDNNEMLMG